MSPKAPKVFTLIAPPFHYPRGLTDEKLPPRGVQRPKKELNPGSWWLPLCLQCQIWSHLQREIQPLGTSYSICKKMAEMHDILNYGITFNL